MLLGYLAHAVNGEFHPETAWCFLDINLFLRISSSRPWHSRASRCSCMAYSQRRSYNRILTELHTYAAWQREASRTRQPQSKQPSLPIVHFYLTTTYQAIMRSPNTDPPNADNLYVAEFQCRTGRQVLASMGFTGRLDMGRPYRGNDMQSAVAYRPLEKPEIVRAPWDWDKVK